MSVANVKKKQKQKIMKGRKRKNEKEEVRVKILNQKLEREKIDSKNEVTTGVSQTQQIWMGRNFILYEREWLSSNFCFIFSLPLFPSLTLSISLSSFYLSISFSPRE